MWLAPPCSSWVFLSRHTTRRSKNMPLGRSPRPSRVVANNRLVSRMCHLLEFFFGRGIYYIIEQPRSSLMFEHPRLKKLLRRHAAAAIKTELGAFGAETLKPVIFTGTAPIMDKLAASTSSQCRTLLKRSARKTAYVYFDQNGKKCVVGNGKVLKNTQSYPTGLGLALGKAWKQFKEGTPPAASPAPVTDADASDGSCCDGYDSDRDCLDDLDTWQALWSMK